MAIQVSAARVVGRDQLIDTIWNRLRTKSLRFTAERRIGKTTVMTKMAAEPRPQFDVVFLEVEGVDSPDRFTEILLARIKPLLSGAAKATGWFDNFLDTVGGTEIGGVVKLPGKNKIGWQATLEKAVEGLCQHQSDRTLVLMFDELPYMLQKIEKGSKDADYLALTMLDTMRALRQRHKNLRMIFAGSVGLHHVLKSLKQSELASEPVNDMPAIEIHALEHSDAILLAKRLLSDEKVAFADTVDADQIAAEVASLADQVPFYIEAVVSRLSELSRPVEFKDVRETVELQITNDNDPWEMEHFRERIDIYYHGNVADASNQPISNAEIARRILDHFACVDQPLSIEQVWEYARSQFPLVDRQHIVQMLKSLGQDHYLKCGVDKRYTFRFPMIQRWWKIAQGLS